MQLYGPRAELRRTDKRKGQPAEATVYGGGGGDDGMMESEVSQSRRGLLLVES